MRTEVLFGVEPLRALAPDWWRLFGSAPAATPFQSPAWLLTWCRHIGRGKALSVLLRDGSGLAALAPFSLGHEEGARVLRPLGSGISDICDALIAGGREHAAASTLLEAMLGCDAWDRCVWDGLPASSPIVSAIQRATSASRTDEVAPVLRLKTGITRYAQAVPDGMARNILASRKRAEKLGGIGIVMPAAAECAPFLDTLFALHAARWRIGGAPGVLGDPSTQRFHKEALPALLEAGLARAHLVTIGGRPAAAHYGLAAERAHFYYIGGFDPELRGAGPGHLAVAHAIDRALAEGATAFHFLRGDEPYKRRWGAQPEMLITLSFRR
jgi:CelD/BcsL family acetyltransferase involved in cellulose biosynthesis